MSAKRRRLLVLAGLLLFAGAVYATLLLRFQLVPDASERRFDDDAHGPGRVGVYVDINAVDVVRQTMRARLTATPDEALSGQRRQAPARDLLLTVQDGASVYELPMPAEKVAPSQDLELDFWEGTPFAYPFDRYHAQLRLRAWQGSPLNLGARVPIGATVWTGVSGFDIDAGARVEKREGGPPGDLVLTLDARRPGLMVWFALVSYGVMVALSASALVIGCLLFLRIRRPDAALLGAGAGMTFTVLMVRLNLPGAPPLGVAPDLLVLIWAQLAAVTGLVLMLWTWARAGPPP